MLITVHVYVVDALVEEYDVRLPDLVGQNTDDSDAAVVGRVPLQLIVFPLLQRTVHTVIITQPT